MKEEGKENQTKKEVNNKKILGKKHQIETNQKSYGQSQNKIEKFLISQTSSNEISHPTAIFNNKGNLTYIQCTITDNMKTVFKKYALEIKENINDLCFKMNGNIINDKLKFEELLDNGNDIIRILVENKMDMVDSENRNYIIAEINVKDKDLNKGLRIINSSKEIKEHLLKDEDYDVYNNEEEIKKCKIEINGKTIPFDFFIKFKETGIFTIKYIFSNNLTKATCMFAKCYSLINIDLSNFNTQNITNMESMFNRCESLTNIDLSNFNTRNVIDMKCMFYGCNSLTNIDLSNFDTQNVADMSHMFSECSSLTNVDLSNFNTKKLTDMRCMFFQCKSLININLSHLNAQNVTNMNFMFDGCESLTNIDLSNSKKIKNTISMDFIFYRCHSLIQKLTNIFNGEQNYYEEDGNSSYEEKINSEEEKNNDK